MSQIIDNKEEKRQKKQSIILDIINKFVIFMLDSGITIILLSILVIGIFAVNVTTVQGDSMRNTFRTGNMLAMNMLDKNFKRGDVIITFSDNRSSGAWIENSISTAIEAKTRTILIKRVIGLPGETIEMKDKRIYIYNNNYPDGYLLDEPYANIDWYCPLAGAGLPSSEAKSFEKYKIPEDSYFVMGDNRGCSKDSRYYKAFNRNSILGKKLFQLY